MMIKDERLSSAMLGLMLLGDDHIEEHTNGLGQILYYTMSIEHPAVRPPWLESINLSICDDEMYWVTINKHFQADFKRVFNDGTNIITIEESQNKDVIFKVYNYTQQMIKQIINLRELLDLAVSTSTSFSRRD